jgi:hypothetical protein
MQCNAVKNQVSLIPTFFEVIFVTVIEFIILLKQMSRDYNLNNDLKQ